MKNNAEDIKKSVEEFSKINGKLKKNKNLINSLKNWWKLFMHNFFFSFDF